MLRENAFSRSVVCLGAFVAGLTASLPARSEAFCSVLQEVQKASRNDFADLGPLKGTGDFRTTDPLSVKLPGSDKCIVQSVFGSVTYNCEHTYDTRDEMLAGQKQLHNDILACYPKTYTQGGFGETMTLRLSVPKDVRLPVVTITITLRPRKGKFVVNANVGAR